MFKKLSVKGQGLVIFALALAGLIAMAALIIDGGGMYVNRRQAQTAADAAAMAGAYELCFNQGNLSSVTNVVNNYAMTQNNATTVDSVSIDANAKTVSVGTTVSSQSFFAVILGQENNIASAEASAGCFRPGAFKGVLPIAWTCRPAEGQPFNENCYLHQIPWKIFQTLYTNESNFQGKTGTIFVQGDGVTPSSYVNSTSTKKMLYIIIDDDTFDIKGNCKPPVGLNTSGIQCDLNGDGISDIYGGANRGWLYLDGDPKPGAAALKNIIQNGFSSPISIPQWFEGTNGVSTTVFQEIRDSRVGDLAILPIYTAACDNTKASGISTKCPSEFQVGDSVSQATSGNSATFYRVGGFAPFVVTCVSTKNNEHCPGKEFTGIDHNAKTVEGYFISDYSTGADIAPGSSLDLGVYIISLIP